jgi:hypothetical protein
MILSLAVLSTALLFGGMTLYSFGFAAFLFSALPAKTAGETLRRAFPWFYAFVIATSAAAALLWWHSNPAFAAVMAAVAITTVPVRQVLMPAINRATDAGLRQRFKRSADRLRRRQAPGSARICQQAPSQPALREAVHPQHAGTPASVETLRKGTRSA